MRVPLKSRPKGSANTGGCDGWHPGSRASDPAMTLNRNAASATDQAIGPFPPNPKKGNGLGAVGTRPTLGRRATTLLKLAGLRSDPPRSLPSAIGRRPAASAAPAPPLDPPGLFDRSYGLSVAP